MYRSLVLLLVTAVSSAPKGNSDITYVKLHPLPASQPPARTHYRESRIENLPLTIPGNIAGRKDAPRVKEIIEEDVSYPASDEANQNLKVDRVSEEVKSSSLDIEKSNEKDKKATEKDLVTVKDDERTEGLEVNAKRLNPKIIHAESKSENLSDKQLSEKPLEDNKSDIAKSNLTKRSPDNNDNNKSNNNESDRLEGRISEAIPSDIETTEKEEALDLDITDEYLGIADVTGHLRSENIDAATIYDDVSDTTPLVTEKNKSLEELIRETDEYEARTRAPGPRFLSKLSYFQKNADDDVVTNFIERTGKRGFKSKCRCEKMWNCPKLQITVPRCPTDYFLCC